MAERLTSLAYAHQRPVLQQQQQQDYPSQQHLPFQSRQISVDIRSPEELAAVNEFLLTLGKDITSSAQAHSRRTSTAHTHHAHHPTGPITPGYHTPGLQSPSSYFDAVSLTQLGLANMPGITLPSPPPASQDSSPASMLGLNTTSAASATYSASAQDYSATGFRGTSAPAAAAANSNAFTQFARTTQQQQQTPPYLQTISIGSANEQQQRPQQQAHSQHGSRPGTGSASAYRPSPPLSHASVSAGGRTPSPGQAHHLTSPFAYHPPQALPHAPPSSRAAGQHQQQQHAGSNNQPDGAASFDFVARNAAAAAASVPQLAAYEAYAAGAHGHHDQHSRHNLRTTVLLRSVPGLSASARSSDGGGGDDAMTGEEERKKRRLPPPEVSGKQGTPARLVPSSTSSTTRSSSGSLYPMLSAGDANLRLPPLVGTLRAMTSASSSSSSSPSSPTASTRARTSRPSSPSRSSTPTPTSSSSVILPPLAALTADLERASAHARGLITSTGGAESELAHGVARIDLGVGVGVSERERNREREKDRRRHAEFIRDLMVAINRDYRAKFGTPAVRPRREMEGETAPDVEMASV